MIDILSPLANSKKTLVICSRPLDFDCIASGLIMKKYLEANQKNVRIVFPAVMTPMEIEYNGFLPYFSDIEAIDTRTLFENPDFDSLVLVDGGNWIQFYDTRMTNDNPPDFSSIPTRIHIDHHMPGADTIGTVTVHDIKISSTTELIFRDILEDKFITPEIATLGYAGIVGDTGNFKWNFFPSTLALAGKLADKGANTLQIINQVCFSKEIAALKMQGEVIKRTTFDETISTSFMFLPNSLLKREFSDEQLEMTKHIFLGEVALTAKGMDRGFLVYEPELGKIRVSARGSNLNNKINLPEFLKSIGGVGGGHFNACAARFEGEWEEIKNDLIKALRAEVKEEKEASTKP